MKIYITLGFALILLVTSSLANPKLTQSFLPRAFGPTGDIIGVEIIWPLAGNLTTRFATEVINGYYVQGTNLKWSRSSSKPSEITITRDTVQVKSPSDFSGGMTFTWTTYKTGYIRDTVYDTGNARVDFTAPQYQYDIKLSKSGNKFVSKLENFV